MTQLIIAAWAASAVLLFLPLGSVSRFAYRRLGALISHARHAEPQSAASDAGTPAGTALPVEPASPLEPEAAALLEGATDGEAVAEEESSSGREGAEEATPGRLAAFAPRALRFLRVPATMVLYVVFILGTVYLGPRLLVRVLNTDHPMAAVTSQSMFPTLKRGDLVLLQGVDSVDDLRVGDIIAFDDGTGFGIHRIVILDDDSITTKGDANLSTDDPITFDQVIGRTLTVGGRLAKIPYVGNIPLLFKQTSDEDEIPGDSLPLFDAEPDEAPDEALPPLDAEESDGPAEPFPTYQPEDRSRDRSR